MEIRSTFKNININQRLRVGVISDSQLSPWNNHKANTYQKNLYRSLVTLKKLGVNMILFAGDICNLGSKFAYRRYKKCLKKAFGEDMPVVLSVMGNHDYYMCINARKVFEKSLKQTPYVHYVVNGFHFLGVSPCNSSMSDAYREAEEWLEQQLKMAKKDNPDAPIFVVTHHPPKDTVYGSEDWGDKYLDKIFSKYNNIVNFAGHSHFSILDERSYYQGKYRVINTQSVSYIELETGKTNGSVPPHAHFAPMGVVMDFDKEKIYMLRYNLLDGKEQKKTCRWTIPYNVNQELEQKKALTKPRMTESIGEWHIDRTSTILQFSKAIDEDFVHSYKVEYDDGDVQYYFSDFYKGIDKMSQPQQIRLYGKAKGIYNVKVTAINSQGLESENCTQIFGVEIAKKRKYRRWLAPDISY